MTEKRHLTCYCLYLSVANFNKIIFDKISFQKLILCQFSKLQLCAINFLND